MLSHSPGNRASARSRGVPPPAPPARRQRVCFASLRFAAGCLLLLLRLGVIPPDHLPPLRLIPVAPFSSPPPSARRLNHHTPLSTHQFSREDGLSPWLDPDHHSRPPAGYPPTHLDLPLAPRSVLSRHTCRLSRLRSIYFIWIHLTSLSLSHARCPDSPRDCLIHEPSTCDSAPVDSSFTHTSTQSPPRCPYSKPIRSLSAAPQCPSQPLPPSPVRSPRSTSTSAFDPISAPGLSIPSSSLAEYTCHPRRTRDKISLGTLERGSTTVSTDLRSLPASEVPTGTRLPSRARRHIHLCLYGPRSLNRLSASARRPGVPSASNTSHLLESFYWHSKA